MAKVIARIDNYDPRWGSDYMTGLFDDGTEIEKKDWLLDNCKCAEPVSVEEDEIFDDLIGEGDGWMITYGDYGMIEEIKLIEL